MVVGFVVATFGLVVAPGNDAGPESTLPDTIPRELDPAACNADIDRVTSALAESFDATTYDRAGPLAPPATVPVTSISDEEWNTFFEGVVNHCADVGGAVSQVIVFSADRADGAADSAAALTTAQLCSIGLPLSPDARLACASTRDLLDLDDTTPDDVG